MLVAFVLGSAAACAADSPTTVQTGRPPAAPPTPTPTPTPTPNPPDYPSPSRPGATYNRITSSYIPGSQRYVIYDDSTFSLQYVRPDWGFFEYPGKYSRTDAALSFRFDGWSTAGAWLAAGILSGDSLIVKYNLIMQLSDFEDGVYKSSAP